MKTITIKNNAINYNELKAPKIIIDDVAFSNMLNIELVSRFLDKTIVALQNAKNSYEKAVKEFNETTFDKNSDDYKKLSDNVEKFDRLKKERSELEKALRNEKKALEKDYKKIDELNIIVQLYASLFTREKGIMTDKNKTMKVSIKGSKELFNACIDYSRKYESVADDLNETRKADFNNIKKSLNEIGTRLNGDSSEFRKGFNYKVTSKDAFRLIALATSQNKFNKNKGTIKDYNTSFEKFHATILTTIFKIDNNALVSANDVEI